MSHFASSNWSSMFGKGVRLHANISPALFLAVAESPYSGANEGSDLLTFVVPAGESGLYLIAASCHVDTISNA